MMVSSVFRCPATALQAQTWFADEPSANNTDTFESVKCIACGRMHYINRSTGRTLGDSKPTR
jgi:hypothetical protein